MHHDIAPQVDKAMGHDVMKSTANLVPDLLTFSHVMVYHGQVTLFVGGCGCLCVFRSVGRVRFAKAR